MAKRKVPKASPAETEMLRLVWQLKNATVQEVCDHLPSHRRIAYATVQTLLGRLEKKGYLKHSIRGKAYVFSPALDKEEVIRSSVNDFVNRLFGGDPIPLMQYLAEHGKVGVKDIENLKRILKKKK